MASRFEGIAERISSHLLSKGFAPRGWFTVEEGDIPAGASGLEPGTAALLIGNQGADLWRAFERSDEYRDGQPDPLDRFTTREIETAIRGFDAQPVYPFGAPVLPFQRWASRAMGIKASPLGILIHPEYGLWHALRAAILFPGLKLNTGQVHNLIHACDNCAEKPCLSACPVDAFSMEGFAVQACRAYLDSSRQQGPDCMGEGCAARNACPIGQEWRYAPEQVRFHMQAFRG